MATDVTTRDALRAERLDAGYGSHLVVKGASLKLDAGRVVTLLGPNGAGKSTLLKALVGIVQVFDGEVLLGEEPITNRRTEDIANLGIAYVPQVDDVFGPLTVSENLQMGGYLLDRAELRTRMNDILDEFPRLAEFVSRRASTLSGGERKLVAVARALMTNSRFLLLDEPTAALSPSVAAQLLNEITETSRAASRGLLIVEQRARAALEVADEAHILVGGAVRVSDSASALLARDDLGDLLIGAVAQSSGIPA
jgi:branched-chain amino acid transport system ATP-binding protein